jgi:internalin A
MGQLNYLRLEKCAALNSIHTLQAHSSLQMLVINSCPAIDDLTAIPGLPELRWLQFFHQEMRDLRAIHDLPRLEQLKVASSQQLRSTHGLEALPCIQLLSFHECRALSDLSGISSLFRLRELAIFDAVSITDLQPLTSLKNLQSFYLHAAAHIHTLAGLEDLLQIHTLCACDCPELTDFRALSGLTKLETLWLYKTPIEDLSLLAELKELRELNLDYCERLHDISALEQLPKLERLQLQGADQIEDVRPLLRIPSLQRLQYPSLWYQQHDLPPQVIEELKQLKQRLGLL